MGVAIDKIIVYRKITARDVRFKTHGCSFFVFHGFITMNKRIIYSIQILFEQ